MKPIICLLAAILLCCIACKKEADTAAVYPLTVDIQAYFQTSSVQVLVDENEFFYSRVTTNPITGLAHSITRDKNAGSHQMRVLADDKDEAVLNFTLDKHRYIGINRAADGKLSFIVSDTPFVYF